MRIQRFSFSIGPLQTGNSPRRAPWAIVGSGTATTNGIGVAMKALLFAVGLVSFGTGQTFAADIPIKAPTKPIIAYDGTRINTPIGDSWSFDRPLWRPPNPIPGTLLPKGSVE